MGDDRATKEVETRSVRGTMSLGAKMAARLGPGDLVALEGELGAGKTVLVRGIARGLGADERAVSSPTYVLVQEYAGRCPVYHVDLYRLPNPAIEASELGLEEMLERGVVLIEWSDRAARVLPRPYWHVRIEPTGPRARRFTIERVE